MPAEAARLGYAFRRIARLRKKCDSIEGRLKSKSSAQTAAAFARIIMIVSYKTTRAIAAVVLKSLFKIRHFREISLNLPS
jgi:hypothetical protein